MDIEAKVKEIIADQFSMDEDEISIDSNLEDDLNITDLDFTELNMALEETFEIEIPDEEMKRLKTVQGLIDYIKRNTDF